MGRWSPPHMPKKGMKLPVITGDDTKGTINFGSSDRAKEGARVLTEGGMSGLTDQYEADFGLLVFVDRQTAESALEMLASFEADLK